MKKRKKHLFLIIVIIIALAAICQVITTSMLGYLSKLDKKIEISQQKLLEVRREIQQNEKYVLKWKEISKVLSEPVPDRRTNFRAYLQSLVLFDSLTPQTDKPLDANGKFQVLSYQLLFSVNLRELAQFLAQLDASDRLLRIEKLQVTTRPIPVHDVRWENSLQSTRDLIVNLTVSIPAQASSPGANIPEISL